MEDRYNVECCDFIHAHEEIVERVRGQLPGEDTLYDLTELFCTSCLRRRCACATSPRCWA